MKRYTLALYFLAAGLIVLLMVLKVNGALEW